jgi:hypothetical protein
MEGLIVSEEAVYPALSRIVDFWRRSRISRAGVRSVAAPWPRPHSQARPSATSDPLASGTYTSPPDTAHSL